RDAVAADGAGVAQADRGRRHRQLYAARARTATHGRSGQYALSMAPAFATVLSAARNWARSFAPISRSAGGHRVRAGSPPPGGGQEQGLIAPAQRELLGTHDALQR